MKGLKEIKARLAAATPGPWSYEGVPYDGTEDPVVMCSDKGQSWTGYICQTVYDMQSATQRPTIDADTVFIANTPTDIAALVARVEELEGALTPQIEADGGFVLGEVQVVTLSKR